MNPVHHADDEADGGYLCDLLGQHGIAARMDGSFHVFVDEADRLRAWDLIQEALPSEDIRLPSKSKHPLGVFFSAVVTVVMLVILVNFPLVAILDGTAGIGSWIAMVIGLVVIHAMWKPEPPEDWKRYGAALLTQPVVWTKTHVEAYPWRSNHEGDVLKLSYGDGHNRSHYVVRVDGQEALTRKELPDLWTVPRYVGAEYGPPRFTVEEDPAEEGWVDPSDAETPSP